MTWTACRSFGLLQGHRAPTDENLDRPGDHVLGIRGRACGSPSSLVVEVGVGLVSGLGL